MKIRAERLARRKGISLAELIRLSLEVQLKGGNAGEAGETREDPLFADQEVYGGSAPRDLARNHDRYLYGD